MTDTPKRCSACGAAMNRIKREKVQLGKSSFIFGDWPNLMAGALAVEIWCCPECGKIDFYRDQERSGAETEGHIAQVTCPACGTGYDLDYPKCPWCGAKNPSY